MVENSEKISSKARQHARRYAMQAMYQWHLARPTVEDLLVDFMTQDLFERADKDYFQEVVTGIISQINKIDETLSLYLDRPVTDLNPVELSVLRVAMFELMYRLDIPYRVVLNEAIELAKKYGSVDGRKYVNAVLDNAASQLREVERNAHGRKT